MCHEQDELLHKIPPSLCVLSPTAEGERAGKEGVESIQNDGRVKAMHA